MTSQNRIIQIYKSRSTVLSILETVYGYDISDYSGFSVNEIDAMNNHEQLDMLLTHTKDNEKPIHKTYIKYFISKGTLNSAALSVIVEDLFTLSDTLTKKDCLYIIYEGEPNDSLLSYLEFLHDHDGIFVVVSYIKRLQFNLLENRLVPQVSILNEKEVEEFKLQFSIEDYKKMPEISRFDPQALAICLRPGSICKFLRKSPTALVTPYYRYCI